MVSFKTLSFLTLTGSALAAPAPHKGHGGKHTEWKTVVATAYVTVPYGYQPAPVSSSVPPPPPPPPAPTTSVYVEAPKPVTSSSPPVYTSPPVKTLPPSSQPPAPTTSKAPAPAPSTGTYMDTVNEWRGKLGLKDLIMDSTLQSNAARTAKEGNGQMVHHLYEGSMGQVLAPGQPDQFYHVFVGGWLCEKPDMAGMNGVCSTASEGWYYEGTGHADILTSDSYSKIGCGCEGGIWACDLA